MRESMAKKRGLQPIARIVGHTEHSHEPAWFTTAPVSAIRKLLEKLNWQAGDVDLYEVNEAFAVVTMAAMRDLELDHRGTGLRPGQRVLGGLGGLLRGGARLACAVIR